jgi:hypothetical protein
MFPHQSRGALHDICRQVPCPQFQGRKARPAALYYLYRTLPVPCGEPVLSLPVRCIGEFQQ